MKNLGLKNFNHKTFLISLYHKEQSQSDKWLTYLFLFCFVIFPISILSEGKIIGTIVSLAYAYLVCSIIHNNKTVLNGGTKSAYYIKSFVFLLFIPFAISNFFVGDIYSSGQNVDSKKKFTNYYTHKDNPDVIVCEFVTEYGVYIKEYIGADTGFCYASSRGNKGRKVNPHTYYRGKFN